jgi:hypothetical protein
VHNSDSTLAIMGFIPISDKMNAVFKASGYEKLGIELDLINTTSDVSTAA